VVEVDDEPAAVTPTLSGRLQTRLVLLATVGVLATLLITPVLPRPEGASLTDAYEITFRVLLAVLVIGWGWEFVYHFIQQWRWEKDWPTLCVLLCGINEAALLWVLIKQDVIPWIDKAHQPSFEAFVIHFAFVWVVVWLFIHGPMRVFAIRWRYRGSEIL
jgi:hypothetical protein